MFGFLKRKKKNKKVDEVKQAPTPVKEVKEEPVPVKEVKEEPAPVKEEAKPVAEKPAPKKPRQRKPVNHITKHKDGGWQVKKEGAQRALRKFDTQKEAIEFAKQYENEKGVDYIIHKADGTTRKKNY